ncbi:hypothetical protein M0805_002088 [Coniferiporia weirii]|nr:hypothetical protein M0805_002088 [Coniferiporia weirii]
MSEDLKSLLDIISSSVHTILDTCKKTGKEFPSLNHPAQPSEFSPDGVRNDPAVVESIGLIVAAATQLIATVQPPAVTVTNLALRFTVTAALGVAEAANVAEIIRPAGPKGMHIRDIAAKSNTDPGKLSHFLRYLATNHCFNEVAPDVFSHNLLSSLIDTGKEITADFAQTKYDSPQGMAALIAFEADEAMKAASYFQEVVTDPKTAFSEEVNDAGIQKALRTDLSLWDYYDLPEGQHRRRRFAVTMSSGNSLVPPGLILSSYDWASVPKGGLIVDVGGGLGHVSLEVAKAHPDLQVVVEDRSLVLEQAKQHWEVNFPQHIRDGKAHFITADYFEPQPVLPGTPDIFMMRMIIHDWSDKYAIRLLRRLREAAGPSTKLIIIDSVLDYACENPNDAARPPRPLLPNMGAANIMPYAVDLVTFGILNAGERTIGGFENILAASGWQLQEIRRNPAAKSWWPSIISVPSTTAVTNGNSNL